MGGDGTRAADDSPVASPLDPTTPMPDPLAPVPNSVLAARSATISGCDFDRGEEIGYTFEELALVRS